MNKLIIICCTLLIVGCTAGKKTAKLSQGNINELQQLMSGSFDSEKQSIADTTYYNISLKMVPIWKSTGGHWLYVEQAVASMQDRPYRQRVYKLVDNKDGSFTSFVYTLSEPKNWIGKWSDPASFDEIGPDDLSEREGCGVHLKKMGEKHYAGSTREKECTSVLRGAVYATSIVTIKGNGILSWDQGFDRAGKQVWGATEAGYFFDRK